MDPRVEWNRTELQARPWSWNTTREEIPDFTSINRTHTGVLLLAISLILGPIPYIMYLGYLLGLIGVVLVILGRRVFGELHAKLVLFSVGIWLLGIFITFIVGASFASDVTNLFASGITQSALAQSLNNSVTTLVIGLLVASAVLGLANVLITYALQTTTGRAILLVGYVSALGTGIILLSIILPQVNAAVVQTVTTQDPTPLTNLEAQNSTLGIIGIIPASISALAFLLAYRRIGRGEIPNKTTVTAEASSRKSAPGPFGSPMLFLIETHRVYASSSVA